MIDDKIKIDFSNGSSVIVNEKTILFPLKISEKDGKSNIHAEIAIQLTDYYHASHGFIPILAEVLATSEFFSIDTDDLLSTKIYKTSSVVSLERVLKNQVKIKTFPRGL